MAQPDDWRDILAPLLRQAGIGARIVAVEPLTGGVSSDIVRVDLDDGTRLCAKRALPTLKVADTWEAPTARNHSEVEWLRRARAIAPGSAPDVLAEDAARGVALLEYLPPEDHVLWKAELLAGRYDPAVPAAVAASLARIHAATWGDAATARTFRTDALFDALRLDPYLRTLAARTPDLSQRIMAVVETTASTRLALVHGDVSPKNILVSRSDGHPVLLDAECAWYGDPVFDPAFCINHLTLKAVHLPALRERLIGGADAFFSAWLAGIPETARADAERRFVALLPCLQLARIDGKSPVEYLSPGSREIVRALARPLIAEPARSFAELRERYAHDLARLPEVAR